jgi:hypothetical protein
MRFTELPIAHSFRPLVNQLRNKLGSRFLFDSFFKLVDSLESEGRAFKIIFRTFGHDLIDVQEDMNAFAAGEHPLYPGKVRPHLRLETAQMYHGRYHSAAFKLHPFNADAASDSSLLPPPVVPTEAEVLTLIEDMSGSKVMAINDDYDHWSQHDCHPSAGKPCWLHSAPSAASSPARPVHLFFDDNIHNDPDDSIVAVRRVAADGSITPLSGAETIEEEGKSIVKVFCYEAIMNDDYFINHVDKI